MKKALVIENDPNIRYIIGETLEMHGYQVTIAMDGLSGVELFFSEPAGIVITDICMPIMDGIEVIKNIKSHFQNTKIIAISGGIN